MSAIPPPSPHGGEVYSLARRLRVAPEALLDCSSNANIFAYALTEDLLRKTPYPFLHYPDSSAGELGESIAAHEGVEPSRVLPGNGAADLIWLALRALAPRKVLFIGPVFSEYVLACTALAIPFELIAPSWQNDFLCTPEELSRLWESDADCVILCNPNNPSTASYDMRRLLHMLRAPRVLVDSSYREFLYGTEEYEDTSIHAYNALVQPGVSLLSLHSFTKFFCCPGIRLGYLIGDAALLARMAGLRPSWTVSPFAQIMGLRFLEERENYRETLPALREAVAHMGRELRRLSLMEPDKVFEGPGFLCCGLAKGQSSAAVCQKLLQRHHIILRDCDGILGMPPGFLRIQARPDKDSSALFEALRGM